MVVCGHSSCFVIVIAWVLYQLNPHWRMHSILICTAVNFGLVTETHTMLLSSLLTISLFQQIHFEHEFSVRKQANAQLQWNVKAPYTHVSKMDNFPAIKLHIIMISSSQIFQRSNIFVWYFYSFELFPAEYLLLLCT